MAFRFLNYLSFLNYLTSVVVTCVALFGCDAATPTLAAEENSADNTNEETCWISATAHKSLFVQCQPNRQTFGPESTAVAVKAPLRTRTYGSAQALMMIDKSGSFEPWLAQIDQALKQTRFFDLTYQRNIPIWRGKIIKGGAPIEIVMSRTHYFPYPCTAATRTTCNDRILPGDNGLESLNESVQRKLGFYTYARSDADKLMHHLGDQCDALGGVLKFLEEPMGYVDAAKIDCGSGTGLPPNSCASTLEKAASN